MTSFLFSSTISQAQPLPKRVARRLREVFFELVEAAELRVDRLGQFGARLAAVFLQQLPEQRVVGVAAAVVLHGGANLLRQLVEIGDQLLDRLIAEVRCRRPRR